MSSCFANAIYFSVIGRAASSQATTACLRFAPHLWACSSRRAIRSITFAPHGFAISPLRWFRFYPSRFRVLRTRVSAASLPLVVSMLVSGTKYLLQEPRSGDTYYQSRRSRRYLLPERAKPAILTTRAAKRRYLLPERAKPAILTSFY
jgi:hypothetical protein